MAWQVGDWRVEPELDEIRRGGERVRLEPRSMAVLVHLIECSGQVVSAEELLDRVWTGVVVAPSSVYQTIAQLRRALGDDSENPSYIDNVPRKGYRLIARVEQVASATMTGAADGSAPASAMRRRWHWWQTALAALIVIMGVAFFLVPESLRQRVLGRAPSERSVAVLPFQNFGADPADAYLADGLTEDLLLSIGRLPGVDVTARSSAFVFRERDKDVREIARALNVRYVLDGSVRRFGDRLRVHAQLVNAATGFELWSDSYDRPFADVLRVQEDIARAVARSLTVLLTRETSQRLARHAQFDPDAFDAYLRGRSFWNERSVEGLHRAMEQYDVALRHDADDPRTHVALAELLVVLPLYGIESPQIAFPRARAAASRALELDAALAEARATLAVVRYQYDWDWAGAEEEFQRSLALNPSYATARQWYAEFLSYAQRFQEAEAQIRLAQGLDPLSPTITTLRGSPALWAHRYPEGAQAYREALAVHPDFALAHYSLGLCQVAVGQAADAVASFQRSLSGLGAEFVAPSLAHAYVALGREREARDLLELVLLAERKRFVSPYKIAVLHAALGEVDSAFARLNEAYEIHDDRLVLLRVDPLLDPLRSDPRFGTLLQRTGAVVR